MPVDRPSRPGRRCARVVLALLRDGRTRPDEWNRRERAAVTRLHAWAFRHGADAWPAPHGLVVGRVRVEEDEHGVRPIRAGDAPSPLPSEVLQSCDGGRGIAGFVLSVEVLDRLPVLMRDEVPPGGLLVDDSRDSDEDPDRFAEELLDTLRRLGDEYGPLGVAIAAATLTDPRVLVAQIDPDAPEPEQPVPAEVRLAERDGYEANLDALRAEVARLSGLLDDASREADRADEAEATLATYRREVDEQTARAEGEHAARLRAERLLDGQQRATTVLREQLDAERARAERAVGLVEPVELYVPAPARVTWDGTKLRALYLRPHDGTVESEAYTDGKGRPLTVDDVHETRPRETVRPPIEEDPRRPHPDSWPDDAVLLRYVELRRLVSLHLERYGDQRAARSMLEGDVPLRLSEVLG